MSLEEEEFGSDTDDDDYVPDCDPVVASEEENSGDDEGDQDEAGKKKGKKKTPGEAVKKKKKIVASGGRGFMFEEESTEGEGSVDWKAEVEKEKAELNEEVEKKKTEDIWAEFKRDTGGAKPKPKPTGGGLASIIAPTAAPPVKSSLPAKPKSRFGSLFDNVEKSKEEAVGEGEREAVVKEKPKNRFGSLFDAPPKVEQAKESEDSPLKSGNKVEITKVFDFAGEVVKVSKQVSADSKEAAKFLSGEATSSTTKRPGGLAGVVGSITKKPKMGCLDKSKLDWNQFVQEKNIREELSTHNKGKDGYVEKLEFLERADLRQFEQEKALREKTRKSLMK